MRTTEEDVRAAGFDTYVDLLERLCPELLPELRLVTSEAVRFRDPFHDVEGRGALLAVMESMFHDVGDLVFEVRHRCMAPDGGVGFIAWRLSGRLRRLGNRPWTVEGMSEIHMDTQGLVTAHIDHWDAASGLYAHVPVLGGILGALRRRIAVL